MNVAILNISIGSYKIFWKDFYLSMEKNFLPNSPKHYFVFSDTNIFYGASFDNVTFIKQKNLGWPYNTMKRFQMFQRIASKLLCYDYVFFLNSNAYINETMDEKFISRNKNIITIVHPGLYGTPLDKMPFERNPKSNAYVKYGDGKFYVQGAFIGGKSKNFVDMINELNRLTEDDLKNGIIAKWHDESFLNKYILNRPDVQIIGRQYLYYEEYVFPWKPVIILRNKRRYGDLKKFRGLKADTKLMQLKTKGKLYVRNIIYHGLIILHLKKRLLNITDFGEYVDIDLNQ